MSKMLKLTEKYAPFRYSENPIYSAFQCLFHEVFCDVPDVDLDNASYSNGCFRYDETEEETRYYEEHYMDLSNVTDDGTEKESTLNKIENDIVDFAQQINQKMLVFTGRKGWGKTTILRSVFYHILLDKSKGKILPIYISFNRHINRFNALIDDQFKSEFNVLIRNNISQYTQQVMKRNDDGFWDFLRKKLEYAEFNLMCARLEDKRDLGVVTEPEYFKQLYQYQDEIIKDNRIETLLYALQYLEKKDKIKVVFVFDDLDPLKYDFVKWLFNESYHISHIYYFKTILSMRPNTYQQIKERNAIDAITPLEHRLSRPNCHAFIEHKLDMYKSKVISSSRPITIELDNLRIQTNDAQTFMERYCKVALTKDAITFLDNVCGGDLRILKKMLYTYLSSGYMKADRIMSLITFDEHKDTLPIWIVYTSIITNNYSSVFSKSLINRDEFVINLLCNGGGYINNYLISLHLLSYICRSSRTISVDELMELYTQLIPNNEVAIRNSISYAIRRFNNGRLITNDKYLYIEHHDEVQTIKSFQMLPLGRYYLQELVYKFEYLVYMKDDVFLPEEIINAIQDCLTVVTNSDRFQELTKYLHFLFEKEREFLSTLSGSRMDTYINHFSPLGSELIYSQSLVNRMIEYAERRNIDCYDLTKLKETICKFKKQYE